MWKGFLESISNSNVRVSEETIDDTNPIFTLKQEQTHAIFSDSRISIFLETIKKMNTLMRFVACCGKRRGQKENIVLPRCVHHQTNKASTYSRRRTRSDPQSCHVRSPETRRREPKNKHIKSPNKTNLDKTITAKANAEKGIPGSAPHFFWGVDGRFRSEARSGHLSLTHGPAGNRTTTGNLSGISTSSTLCCNSLQQQHLNDCNQHSAQLHIVS